MGDLIENLPIDKTPATLDEKIVLDRYFPIVNDPLVKSKIYIFKDSLIGAILFGLLSQPFIDELIKKIFTFTTNNAFSMLIIKMIIFFFAFFFISNYKFLQK